MGEGSNTQQLTVHADLNLLDELLEHDPCFSRGIPRNHVTSRLDGAVGDTIEFDFPASNLVGQVTLVEAFVVPRSPRFDHRALQAENPRFSANEVDDSISVSRIDLDFDI